MSLSRLRRLLREAGRASTCMRRLDQSLDPVRQMTSTPGSRLIGVEQRLATLTSAEDPFARLAHAVDRAGSKPERDHTHSLAVASGFSRKTLPPEGGSHSLQHVGAGFSRPGFRPPAGGSHTLEHPGRLKPAPTYHPPAGGSQTDSVPVASGFSRKGYERPPEGGSHTLEYPGRLKPAPTYHPPAGRSHTDSVYVGAGFSRPEYHPPAGGSHSHPHVSASEAAAILVERCRAAMTLDAFRTVVRVSSADQPADVPAARPQDRTKKSPVMHDGFADSRWPWSSPAGATSVDRVENAVAAPVSALRHIAPSPDAPHSSIRLDDDVRGPGHGIPDGSAERRANVGGGPSWLAGDAGLHPAAQACAVGAPGLTGLRRLAALATESIEERAGAESPVTPVRPSESALQLDQELDRILRSEALSHGIDLDGQVR